MFRLRSAGSAVMLCMILAACSTPAPKAAKPPIEASAECNDFNVNHGTGKLGFNTGGKGQPIDEENPEIPYEHVHIHECGVQLVMPTQPSDKTSYGQKFYRLYQQGDDTPVYVGEPELGAVQWIDWDEGTVSTELLDSQWYVLPVHAFRCLPREKNRAQNPFTCEGKVVRGMEVSTYEGNAWDVSAGFNAPQVKPVKLKFTGAKSEGTEDVITVTQQIVPDVRWVDAYPVVWNGILARKDQRVMKGRGKPCYRERNWCLDWAQLQVTVTTTSLVSTQTGDWAHLMADDGDWRLTVMRGKYPQWPFKSESEPQFSTVLPDRPMRAEMSGSVRGLTATWQKKHSYMSKTDVSWKGEADIGVASGTYGEVTKQASTDGTSTAVEMKYKAPDDVPTLCLMLMEIVKKEPEDPPITGVSMEGCRK